MISRPRPDLPAPPPGPHPAGATHISLSGNYYRPDAARDRTQVWKRGRWVDEAMHATNLRHGPFIPLPEGGPMHDQPAAPAKRRKAPAKPVPLEDRPEFLALVAALPESVEQLDGLARQALALFHDAVLAADEQALGEAVGAFNAVVFKLNGGTFFGCKGGPDKPLCRLQDQLAAKPGQVPAWGQAGEFLLVLEDGLRLRAALKPDGPSDSHGVHLYAVDLDRPFPSRTGFRHLFIRVRDHLGCTVDQAVRAEVLANIAAEGVHAIDQAHRPEEWPCPAWLAEVLAGVTANGQLAMFGESAPRAPAKKKDATGAARQKRRRDKLRQLKEAEGLKPVMLTELERLMLFAALDLEHAIKPHDEHAEPLHLALLQKLHPGARWTDEARQVAAGILKRDANQQAADRWRIEAARQRAEASRWAKRAQEAERLLRELRAEVERLAGAAAQGAKADQLAARVRYLEDENALVITERSHAYDAVEVLQNRLRRHGLEADYHETEDDRRAQLGGVMRHTARI